MQKRAQWTSSFRIVKYDVSWGSPCSKNQAMMWRNTLNFQSIFHDFFVIISSKIMRKSWKTVLCTNIVKELTFGAPCVRTVAIFRWFLGARGALGTSRQRRRRRPFFNEFSVACGNRPRLVPGTPQGGSREAPGVPQAPPAQHFHPFWIDFPGGFPHSLFRRSI